MPYIYQCPYCKSNRQVKPDSLTTYGNPFRECSKCQKTYIDPYCKELALKPYQPHSKFTLFFSNFFSAIGLDVIITVIVMFISQSELITGITLGIAFPVCWVLLFLHALWKRKKIEQNHLELWKASEKRLQNQKYAALLANLDYPVPKHYLPPDFKYSSEKENYKPAKVSGFRIGS